MNFWLGLPHTPRCRDVGSSVENKGVLLIVTPNLPSPKSPTYSQACSQDK